MTRLGNGLWKKRGKDVGCGNELSSCRSGALGRAERWCASLSVSWGWGFRVAGVEGEWPISGQCVEAVVTGGPVASPRGRKLGRAEGAESRALGRVFIPELGRERRVSEGVS